MKVENYFTLTNTNSSIWFKMILLLSSKNAEQQTKRFFNDSHNILSAMLRKSNEQKLKQKYKLFTFLFMNIFPIHAAFFLYSLFHFC